MTSPGSMLASPEERFGFRMGADRKLVRWADMLQYFQDVASKSDRVCYEQIGEATEGQPFVLLTISSAENLGTTGGVSPDSEAAGRPAWTR